MTKDCFLDLSRVVQHPTFELDDAKEFPRISDGLVSDIVLCIDAGLFVMPPAHATLIRDNMFKLLL